jgi:hypothetical protein
MPTPPEANVLTTDDEEFGDDISDSNLLTLKGSLNLLPQTARHRQALVKNINMLSAASLHNANSMSSGEDM